MRTVLPALLCALCAAVATSDSECHAHSPCRTASPVPHAYHAPHAGHVYLVPAPMYGGYASGSAKPAYAYGWFGVKPRRHKGVHHGYYNNYTQWSYR